MPPQSMRRLQSPPRWSRILSSGVAPVDDRIAVGRLQPVDQTGPAAGFVN